MGKPIFKRWEQQILIFWVSEGIPALMIEVILNKPHITQEVATVNMQ